MVLVCMGILGCTKTVTVSRPSIAQLAEESFSSSNDSHLKTVAMANASGIPPSSELFGDPFGAHTSIRADGVLTSIPENEEEDVLINEDCFDMDLREALIVIGESAGVDMIVDEKLSGVADVSIEDLPIEQAVEKLLLAHNYFYAREGNRIFVGTADPSSPLFTRIAEQVEYRPRHIDSKSLVSTVSEGNMKYVKQVEGTNVILIEAPERIVHNIVSRFELVDKPVPQVVLEAIVCVISPDTGFQIGTDWQHAVDINGSNALKLGISGLAISGSVSNQGIESVFSDFAKTSAFVTALCEHGYLTIRAAPHVTAKDGQKADIGISRETFFSIQANSNTGGDNNSFFIQQDVQKVESGISLILTPHIRGDMVTIDIEKAEVSEDIRTANAEAALNQYPVINRRSVSTTVTVKDGRTIVIGGLVQRETVDRENRIPFLGQIPILGYLFKTTQQQTRDVEVVIFLSPRIEAFPDTALFSIEEVLNESQSALK